MDGIINYKMCAVKVRNAKLRNYLKVIYLVNDIDDPPKKSFFKIKFGGHRCRLRVKLL
jgi:hypothetical protein